MAAPKDAPVPRSLLHEVRGIRALLRERLWLQVLVGMALGIGVGLALAPSAGWVNATTSSIIASWLSLPGQAFLASIKFVVVPLVLASVIRGIAAGESPEIVGRIGSRTVLFFLVTTVIAVMIGLTCAFLIAPGTYIDPAQVSAMVKPAATSAAATNGAALSTAVQATDIPGRIVALVPTNLLTALVQGEMLHIVIGSAIVGVAMLAMPSDQSRPLLDLLGGLQSVCMVIVKWVLRFAPIAVFGLIADISARIGLKAIAGMAIYMATVILGLAILLTVYLLVVWLLARKSPVSFLRDTREALLLAFSTSSSAAVMPLSLQTAETKLGVPPAVSRFVIPLGTTINMGGTALYQAVAALFLAQVFGVSIGTMGIVLIVVMAVGAAIGSPGTPGVGIVILASILETVGIPSAGIVLIIGVDRILDMCRTVANVTGDLAAATVIGANLGDTVQQRDTAEKIA